MWNTYDGSIEIMKTLGEHNYPHSYDLVIYEDAGEPYHVPYVFLLTETMAKIAPRLVLSTGGSLQGNSYAWADSWKKAIEFFKK